MTSHGEIACVIEDHHVGLNVACRGGHFVHPFDEHLARVLHDVLVLGVVEAFFLHVAAAVRANAGAFGNDVEEKPVGHIPRGDLFRLRDEIIEIGRIKARIVKMRLEHILRHAAFGNDQPFGMLFRGILVAPRGNIDLRGNAHLFARLYLQVKQRLL